MKVFVTGATGFVGSHLVDALLERGDEVVCLVRSEAKFKRIFADRAPCPVIGDLDDGEALRAGCEGAEVVFHSAALTAARDRAEFFEVNVGATRRLLDAVAEAAPGLGRFVHVSSQAAAGPSISGHPRTEADPSEPVSAYGASKLAGEKAVRESGLPWTIVRPPGVYGPRDMAFLTVFKIARTGILPTFGSAAQELSLVYVHDLIDALIAAADCETSRSKIYFACHPEVVTTRDLAGVFYRAVRGLDTGDVAAPRVVSLPGWLTRAVMTVTGTAGRLAGRATMLSPDKAKELLAEAWTCTADSIRDDTGWQAKVPLATGARETVLWYRQQGIL